MTNKLTLKSERGLGLFSSPKSDFTVFLIICVSLWCFTDEVEDPYSGRTYHYKKHAYSNILKIFPPKNENFQIKISDIFHISAQNIVCVYSLEPPRRGGSNEYHNLCFWAEIRKMYTLVNPISTIWK